MYYLEQIKALEESEKKLSNIIYATNRRIKNAPEGKLYTGTVKGLPVFHTVNNEGVVKYLSKKNKLLIRRLAQKLYDIKFLKRAQAVRAGIQKALTILKKNNMDEVFEDLPQSLKSIVEPYEPSDDQYAANWIKDYELNQKPTSYMTDNGEYVKSKSEQLIANELRTMNIPYKYEFEYTFKRAGGFGYITVHPDFTVLNKRTRQEFVIEHFGRLDDLEYLNKLSVKLDTYFNNGWFCGKPLLYTSESLGHPLNVKTVKKMIETFLL